MVVCQAVPIGIERGRDANRNRQVAFTVTHVQSRQNRKSPVAEMVCKNSREFVRPAAIVESAEGQAGNRVLASGQTQLAEHAVHPVRGLTAVFEQEQMAPGGGHERRSDQMAEGR